MGPDVYYFNQRMAYALAAGVRGEREAAPDGTMPATGHPRAGQVLEGEALDVESAQGSRLIL